jgi:type II secretory pathway pseudopilin PulG
MSILANAKQKAARGSVKEAFKNEAGAIDLASIMVGIIVIGLIGGVIAATVFAVIPWAQDNAAKQQLDAVATAQNAFIGLSTEGGKPAMFGDRVALRDAGLFPGASASAGSPGRVAVTGSGNTAHYVAAVQSSTGRIFYITDTKTQPVQAGLTGNSTVATFNNAQIPGGTVINGATFGSNVAPAVDITWTGGLK